MLSILILSHDRFNGLNVLLNSIKESEDKSGVKVNVAVGINNDSIELSSKKLDLVRSYGYNGFVIEGNRLTDLRSSLFHLAINQGLLPKEGWHTWMDDDDMVHVDFVSVFNRIIIMYSNILLTHIQFGWGLESDKDTDYSKVTLDVRTLRESKFATFNEYYTEEGMLKYYRPSLSGSFFRNYLADTSGMYDSGTHITAGEDIMASCIYLGLVRNTVDGYTVATNAKLDLSQGNENRSGKYSFTEQLESVCKIIDRIALINQIPYETRQVLYMNLLKYITMSCYKHSERFDYDLDIFRHE